MGFMKIHLHIIKLREVIWCGQPKWDWMKEGGKKGEWRGSLLNAMFYSPPADSFNLGVIKKCQTQSIIPTGILSMFQSEKKINQWICGRTLSNNSLNALVRSSHPLFFLICLKECIKTSIVTYTYVSRHVCL